MNGKYKDSRDICEIQLAGLSYLLMWEEEGKGRVKGDLQISERENGGRTTHAGVPRKHLGGDGQQMAGSTHTKLREV